jgi:hypothetical protein
MSTLDAVRNIGNTVSIIDGRRRPTTRNKEILRCCFHS